VRLTASNLISFIARLPRDVWFNYVNPKTRTEIRIKEVTAPEGPIRIVRKSFKADGSFTEAELTISSSMLWRAANAFREGVPINFERVFGSSYNSRSALEALLAHTPQFHWCLPNRIESTGSNHQIKPGHKHIIWTPNSPHNNNAPTKLDIDIVISEVPSESAVYDALTLPEDFTNPEVDIDVQRRHLQIQIALISIGLKLGFRTWIARNDQGFLYGERRIAELEGVINSLNSEALIAPWDQALQAAMHIDCIWFRNGRFLPAVIEVEHSTGIDSGLNRMMRLKNSIPGYPTRWVIVAPDEDREKVITKANLPHFQELNAQFFPYSAVDELYALCQRRNLNNRAVNEEFLDCFMEPCVQPQQHALRH